MARRTGSTYIEKVLNVWAIVLIAWSVYRGTFRTDLPLWFDEFIAKPMIFLLPLFYFINKNEKKKFFTAVALKTKGAGKEILIGILLGLTFFVIGAIGIYVRQKGGVLDLSALIQGKNVIYFALISLFTSSSEEILSRGFVLKRLYEQSKNIFLSSFFASVLFFFLHVPILFTTDKITGTMLLQVMLTDLVLSMAVSFLFIKRRNLIAPIVVHALYSLSIYLFI